MLTEKPMAGATLCVVGNINRDIKSAPLEPGRHLFCDGETSVASMVESIGGGGANSAFAAASLGARVAFLGKVGADALGERLHRTLAASGIAAHLARDLAHSTGTSIALAFTDGQRHFISCLPANRALSFGDLNLDLIAGREHLLRADVWFSEAMLFGGNRELFQAARQRGLSVSIDLNWDPHWHTASRETISARKGAVRDVLPWTDLAHGNATELMEFADAPELETALKRLVDWGARGVVVHLGARGAGYYDGTTWIVEPPAAVKTHRNATGTGDVLSVCMMLLHRDPAVPIQKRLRLANAIVGEFIEGTRRLIPELVP